MTLQQLQYILEVNKTGSVTKAAKNLFLTPPSISNAIRALEEELGYPIFVRGPRGSTLTNKGARVLQHARMAFAHIQQIEGVEPEAIPPFRLETGSYLPSAKAFSRLVEHYPERLLIHQESKGRRQESLDRLVAGEADLVVLFMPEDSLSKFDHFVSKRHLSQQLRGVIPGVIRLGKPHRLYDVPEFDFAELKKEFLVDSPRRSIADSHRLQSKIPFDPFRVRLQDNWLGRYELVQKGLGFQIAIKLPEYLEQEYGFRSIPVPGLNFHVVAVSDPAIPLREEAVRYLELLDEELNQVK